MSNVVVVNSSSQQRLPRKSLYLYIGAFVFLVAALWVTTWNVSFQHKRDNIRKHGQRVIALAVSREKVQYPTSKGSITAKPLISPSKGTLKQYDSVYVYYDRSHVKNVVLDQDETSYNVTMWIVVVKLFGAACALAGIGYYMQRKNKKRTSV